MRLLVCIETLALYYFHVIKEIDSFSSYVNDSWNFATFPNGSAKKLICHEKRIETFGFDLSTFEFTYGAECSNGIAHFMPQSSNSTEFPLSDVTYAECCLAPFNGDHYRGYSYEGDDICYPCGCTDYEFEDCLNKREAGKPAITKGVCSPLQVVLRSELKEFDSAVPLSIWTDPRSSHPSAKFVNQARWNNFSHGGITASGSVCSWFRLGTTMRLGVTRKISYHFLSGYARSNVSATTTWQDYNFQLVIQHDVNKFDPPYVRRGLFEEFTFHLYANPPCPIGRACILNEGPAVISWQTHTMTALSNGQWHHFCLLWSPLELTFDGVMMPVLREYHGLADEPEMSDFTNMTIAGDWARSYKLMLKDMLLTLISPLEDYTKPENKPSYNSSVMKQYYNVPVSYRGEIADFTIYAGPVVQNFRLSDSRGFYKNKELLTCLRAGSFPRPYFQQGQSDIVPELSKYAYKLLPSNISLLRSYELPNTRSSIMVQPRIGYLQPFDFKLWKPKVTFTRSPEERLTVQCPGSSAVRSPEDSTDFTIAIHLQSWSKTESEAYPSSDSVWEDFRAEHLSLFFMNRTGLFYHYNTVKEEMINDVQLEGQLIAQISFTAIPVDLRTIRSFNDVNQTINRALQDMLMNRWVRCTSGIHHSEPVQLKDFQFTYHHGEWELSKPYTKFVSHVTADQQRYETYFITCNLIYGEVNPHPDFGGASVGIQMWDPYAADGLERTDIPVGDDKQWNYIYSWGDDNLKPFNVDRDSQFHHRITFKTLRFKSSKSASLIVTIEGGGIRWKSPNKFNKLEEIRNEANRVLMRGLYRRYVRCTDGRLYSDPVQLTDMDFYYAAKTSIHDLESRTWKVPPNFPTVRNHPSFPNFTLAMLYTFQMINTTSPSALWVSNASLCTHDGSNPPMKSMITSGSFRDLYNDMIKFAEKDVQGFFSYEDGIRDQVRSISNEYDNQPLVGEILSSNDTDLSKFVRFAQSLSTDDGWLDIDMLYCMAYQSRFSEGVGQLLGPLTRNTSTAAPVKMIFGSDENVYKSNLSVKSTLFTDKRPCPEESVKKFCPVANPDLGVQMNADACIVEHPQQWTIDGDDWTSLDVIPNIECYYKRNLVFEKTGEKMLCVKGCSICSEYAPVYMMEEQIPIYQLALEKTCSVCDEGYGLYIDSVCNNRVIPRTKLIDLDKINSRRKEAYDYIHHEGRPPVTGKCMSLSDLVTRCAYEKHVLTQYDPDIIQHYTVIANYRKGIYCCDGSASNIVDPFVDCPAVDTREQNLVDEFCRERLYGEDTKGPVKGRAVDTNGDLSKGMGGHSVDLTEQGKPSFVAWQYFLIGVLLGAISCGGLLAVAYVYKFSQKKSNRVEHSSE